MWFVAVFTFHVPVGSTEICAVCLADLMDAVGSRHIMFKEPGSGVGARKSGLHVDTRACGGMTSKAEVFLRPRMAQHDTISSVTAVAAVLFSLLGEAEYSLFLLAGTIAYVTGLFCRLCLEDNAANLAGILAYSAVLFSPIVIRRPRTRRQLRRLLGRITVAHIILTVVTYAIGLGLLLYAMSDFPVG